MFHVTITATRSGLVGCWSLIQPTECRHGRRNCLGAAVDLRLPAPASSPALPQTCLDRFQPLFPCHDQAASFSAYTEGLLFRERRKSVKRRVVCLLDGDMNQVHRIQYLAADSALSDRPF